MDYASLIEKRRERFAEVETLITDPDLFSDQKKASEIMREHRRLKELLEMWDSSRVRKRISPKTKSSLRKTTRDRGTRKEIPELEASIEDLSWWQRPPTS